MCVGGGGGGGSLLSEENDHALPGGSPTFQHDFVLMDSLPRRGVGVGGGGEGAGEVLRFRSVSSPYAFGV